MADDGRSIKAVLVRFITGAVGPREFETWMYESRELERVLGSAAYADIAALDFGAEGPRRVGALRERVRQEFDRVWPDVFDAVHARAVCEAMIDGSMDLVHGCRVLAGLAVDQRIEGISDFVALASELDGMPTAAQYPLWEPNHLKAQLARLEAHRHEIVASARAALEAIPEPE